MRRERAWIAIVATACALFPDVTSLTGDAGSDVLSPDAAPEASGFDGASDAPLVDASFCSKADATFCDDFDTADLALKWDSLVLRSGSTLDHSPFDAAPSPPNTLLGVFPSAVDAGSITSTRAAYLNKGFTGTYTHFDIAFAMLLVAVDTGNPVYGKVSPLNIVVSLPPSGFHSVQMYVTASGALNYETDQPADGGAQSGQQFAGYFTSPKVGVWSNVDVAIDLAPDGGRATLLTTLDGTVVANDQLLAGWSLGPNVLVQFGLYYPYGTTAFWSIRFDNVTVSAR